MSAAFYSFSKWSFLKSFAWFKVDIPINISHFVQPSYRRSQCQNTESSNIRSVSPSLEIAQLRCSSPVSESFLSTSSFRTEKNKSSSLTVLTSVYPYSSLSFVFFFFFFFFFFDNKTIDCDISCVNQYFLFRLESQLSEKPLVLTSLVSLFKDLSDDLLGLLEGLNVQSVSGWKQVAVVDDLDE